MKDAENLLLEAANKLDAGFVRETGAIDAYGRRVSPRSPDATRFCALGAIEAIGDGKPRELGAAMETLTRHCLTLMTKEERNLLRSGSDNETRVNACLVISRFNDVYARDGSHMAEVLRGAAAKCRQ